MDALAKEQLGDHWTWPLAAKGLSIAYDWFYPDLTAEERKRYAETIVRYTEAALAYADHDQPPANATWSNQVSDYFNQFYWHHGCLGFAAAALSGEEGFADKAARYLRLTEEWLKRHMIPATNQAGEGGGWFESLGYNEMTAIPFAHLLEAWRTSTGEDLFPQSKFLPGNCAWILHSLIPHNGNFVPLDDVHPGSGPNSVGALAPLLAARYRDPYAQHFSKTRFPTPYAFSNLPFLLWHDPALAAADLKKIEKGRWFTGLGQVNVRSGWEKQDALAVYRAGRIYGGHGQHYQAGHFLIYRKGHLLVEDGYYGSFAAEAHNTLYVGGEMRTLARGAHQHFVEKLDGTTFDFARITAYAHDPEFARYDWIDSDLSRAYTPKQAERVTRRFVFLRPRTFVVIDHVRAPEPVETRFRLHAPSAPRIDAPRRLASWAEGEGKLYVQTVLPAEAKLDASRGKESHLFAVAPSKLAAETTLCHVLHAADLDESAPTVDALEAPEGWTGARIRTPEATWAILFRGTGEVTKDLTYSVASDGPVRHLVADLEGKKSRVAGPGAPANVVAHDGPAYFESATGGKFSIKSAEGK
jgi:hypothetical protein